MTFGTPPEPPEPAEPPEPPPLIPPLAGPAPVAPLAAELTATGLPRVPTMPGAIATIGRGLDLNVAARSILRRASLYTGLLTLLAAGPPIATAWAFSIQQGGLDWLAQLMATGESPHLRAGSAFASFASITFLLSAGCLFAIWLDAQLLALTFIGGQATGRTFTLRGALVIARSRYWRLVRASLLVGLIQLIPRIVLQALLTGQTVGSETQVLIVTTVDLLLAAPFAYIGAGIVLGDVGAQEAVRRSWRLAQARWRLAFVVAIVTTAVAYLAAFALGAGLDILLRLGGAVGLDGTIGPSQSVVLAVILVLAIVSIGSLVMTIDGLTVGPQVVAFLGLTGFSSGLDEGANALAPPRPARLISWPMRIALGLNALAAGIAVYNTL